MLCSHKPSLVIILTTHAKLRQGPVIFNCYSSGLKTMINKCLSIGGFADDHTLLGKYQPDCAGNNEGECIVNIQDCLIKDSNSMDQSRLKMNCKYGTDSMNGQISCF